MFRRGKPSVHRAYGQALAVLAGDGLIVLAFQTLAAAGAAVPGRLADLVVTISGSVGLPAGIVAGQAWECEPQTDLCEYQQQKTGSLFAAASVAGAQAAGVESASWRMLGEKLGEAYQVADDILDVASDQETRGKPVGKDLALGRPSAALHLGIPGAVRRLKLLVGEAIDSIPPCPGKAELTALIMHEAQKLLPEEISRRAA
jgi:geranylgeranyl diphosphate synthase type II